MTFIIFTQTGTSPALHREDKHQEQQQNNKDNIACHLTSATDVRIRKLEKTGNASDGLNFGSFGYQGYPHLLWSDDH
jgi:hypothetical protein